MKAFYIELKNTIRNRSNALVEWFFDSAFRSKAKHNFSCSTACNATAFVEIWIKVTGGKPVDEKSQDYKIITRVLEYYLYRNFRNRADPTVPEFEVLKSQYIYAKYNEPFSAGEIKKLYRFVLKHRIAEILKRNENIQNYIALVAVKEVSAFETGLNQPLSEPYWAGLVDKTRLPKYLLQKRGHSLLRRLRKNKTRLQKALAQSNYSKIDFSTADITSLVTLTGTILVFLGFLRIATLSWYFNIPYERYFSATDYLASSISSVPGYLAAGLFTVAFWWFSAFAPANAYSIQHSLPNPKSRGERLSSWSFEILVGSCAALAGLMLYAGQYVEAINPISVVALYVSILIFTRISILYFENPIRAYFCLSLIAICSINVLSSVAREITAIKSPTTYATKRVHHFKDADYDEAQWRVIAITSGFVIFRNIDGNIHVRNRADLTGVTQ
jgi:hypothetical protein